MGRPQVIGAGKVQNPDHLVKFYQFCDSYNPLMYIRGDVNRPAPEFTRAIIDMDMHTSTSQDPHLGDHISIRMTNDALQADGYQSHMLHFRPDDFEKYYLYPAQTPQQVSNSVNKRNKQRDADKKKKEEGKRHAKDRSKDRGSSGAAANVAVKNRRNVPSSGAQTYSSSSTGHCQSETRSPSGHLPSSSSSGGRLPGSSTSGGRLRDSSSSRRPRR